MMEDFLITNGYECEIFKFNVILNQFSNFFSISDDWNFKTTTEGMILLLFFFSHVYHFIILCLNFKLIHIHYKKNINPPYIYYLN